jgi:hypothetical protein
MGMRILVAKKSKYYGTALESKRGSLTPGSSMEPLGGAGVYDRA